MTLKLLEFYPPGLILRLVLDIPPDSRDVYPLFVGRRRLSYAIAERFPGCKAPSWVLYVAPSPTVFPVPPDLVGRFYAQGNLGWDRWLYALPTIRTTRMAVWVRPGDHFSPPPTVHRGWFQQTSDTIFSFVWRPIGGWWYVALSTDLTSVYLAVLSRYQELEPGHFAIQEAFSFPFASRSWNPALVTRLLKNFLDLALPPMPYPSSFPPGVVHWLS
ncbi:MAG: hypothetical protein KM310_00100 [Clostridiales bacterium]|nr:hypothetical protein [Clostridiales bacterium]